MKKILCNFISLVMLLGGIFALSSCRGLTYEYETAKTVVFYEPPREVENARRVINGKKFTLEHAVVYFDDCYSDGEQDDWLKFAEKALAFLSPEQTITYYVGQDFFSRSERDNVFLGTDEPTVFLHNTLQAMSDSRVNYGVLWGVSEQLLCKLKGKTLSPNHQKAKMLLEENPLLSDLDALEFFAPFASEEEISAAKTVARSFAGWLFERKGTEGVKALLDGNLLALAETTGGEAFRAFEEGFRALENEYFAQIGANVHAEPNKYFVRYSPYSEHYPVLIETDWAKFYLEHDYVSPYTNNPYYGEYEAPYSDFSYAGLKKTIATMDEEARAMLAAFDMTAQDLSKPDCFLDDTLYYAGLGGIVLDSRVELCSLTHWAHEFCHVIYKNFGFYESFKITAEVNGWHFISEGMAEYMQEQYAPEAGMKDGSVKIAQTEPQFAEYYQTVRPTVQSDLRAMNDVFAYFSVKAGDYGTLSNSSYQRYASFLYYLAEHCGIENVIAVAKSEKTMEEACGADRFTLWREWGLDLFARFQDTPPDDFLGRIA